MYTYIYIYIFICVVCVYIYVYFIDAYIYIYIYIYIHVYIEREIDRNTDIFLSTRPQAKSNLPSVNEQEVEDHLPEADRDGLKSIFKR